ncbi:MAG: nicotinamidase [Planctomycetaceae bacterium]
MGLRQGRRRSVATRRDAWWGTLATLVAVAGAPSSGTADPGDDAAAPPWRLVTRRQVPGDAAAAWWRAVETPRVWPAAATAVIVCDVWDSHHCRRAVDRLEEFAPRIARVCDRIRGSGGTVIHAPSDCMAAYATHPARLRVAALAARGEPAGFAPPATRGAWCSTLGGEGAAEYPLDQSLGGEDDEPAEHAAWAERLAALGRDPRMPWKSQSPLVPIDPDHDFVTDDGVEVARILAARGVRHVLLVGVHLNMCVLGRPFGLRRCVEDGFDVALVRDLTDTMYDPAQWPWVNHFTGTDRMVEHVERHVCPTVGSEQILAADRPFRSPRDARPTIALVIAEEEYGSHRTLPAFARRRLGGAFRVVEHHVADGDPHSIPGLERLDDADVVVLSARRRGLHPREMAALRRFLAAGKPVVGIRTASHAFEPRPPVADRETWPGFDRDVFGIAYTGHFGKAIPSALRIAPGAAGDALVVGIPADAVVPQSGSLYRIAPLSDATAVLAVGAIPGEADQPVLTRFRRPDGGLSVYTSVGHPDDLLRPEVERMLVNAIHLAAGVKPPRDLDDRDPHDPGLRWVSCRRAAAAFPTIGGLLERFPAAGRTLWARTVIVPDDDAVRGGLTIGWDGAAPFASSAAALEAWYDGRPLTIEPSSGNGPPTIRVPATVLAARRPGVLVLSISGADAQIAFGRDTATVACGPAGAVPRVPLDRWQVRLVGEMGPGLRDMPLPAQFGGPADSVVVLGAAEAAP